MMTMLEIHKLVEVTRLLTEVNGVLSATGRKKGALRAAPVVAGACNHPNCLVLPLGWN